MLITPSPCHELSHLLEPLSPSSVTYFMDGPQLKIWVASLAENLIVYFLLM